jgi:4'-phosphopantetheinyl transferase
MPIEERRVVTVTIWSLTVSAARLATLHATLSLDEQARASRKLGEGAREFIASRGIARELLAHRCGCAPVDISFGIAAQGKPYLEHPRMPLAFNLSHSGGFCALATGRVASVGVDIEAIRPSAADLADTLFTQREARHYAAIPPAEQLQALFRAWVAKEAYLKATGEGLAGGLHSFELNPAIGPHIRAIAINGDAAALHQWQFGGFDVSNAVVGAIAIKTDGNDIELRKRHIDSECPDLSS